MKVREVLPTGVEHFDAGPYARGERIPGASHWVQADAPERVNELLLPSSSNVDREMRGLLKRVVSEPGAETAESFVRRISAPPPAREAPP
jgi:hypothetical protein